MAEKKEIVKLECPREKGEKVYIELELSHAERVLRRKKNGGWRLPEDSIYQMTENGIARKSGKAGGTQS